VKPIETVLMITIYLLVVFLIAVRISRAADPVELTSGEPFCYDTTTGLTPMTCYLFVGNNVEGYKLEHIAVGLGNDEGVCKRLFYFGVYDVSASCNNYDGWGPPFILEVLFVAAPGAPGMPVIREQ